VSWTRDAYAGRFAHHALDCRTVAEIQRGIIKQGKRNTISRLFHANDKEAIATWRLDLNRVLHVFNVRFVTSVWPSLTCRFQTELGINAHATTSDIRHDVGNTHAIGSDVHCDIPNADTITPDLHDVSKTHAIVSEVRNGVTNTRTTGSNVHRNTLRSREDTDSQNQAVSASHTLPITE